MRALLTSALLLSGCSTVGDWAARYTGNVVVDAGEAYEGALTIHDDGRLDFESNEYAGAVFSLSLRVAQADDGALSFEPVTVALSGTPADDCARALELFAASLARDGEVLFGSAQGRFTAGCDVENDEAFDFSLTLSATRDE